MRFISKYAGYSICYQTDIVNHFGDGNSQIVRPLLDCKFSVGSMNSWEMDAARKTFLNFGLGTYEDHVTQEDPAGRFSVFDTGLFQQQHNLTNEQRVSIEEFLLGRWECGNHYIHVEKPRIAAPWPTYDNYRGVKGSPTAERIAEKVREDGYDIDAVIAYERENQGRVEVLDALEALKNPVVEDDAQLVNA